MIMVASIAVPSGIPATSRPPLMQSIMPYSSATRVGGLYSGSALPTTASFTLLVRRASMPANRLGLGMSPYAF